MLNSADSAYSLYERRIYDDEVTLTRNLSDLTVPVIDVLQTRPGSLIFSRCYPNPFNTEIEIEYFLPESSRVTIRVFDLHGKIIRVLEERMIDPWFSRVVWDGKNEAGNSVSPGFYFYRIETSAGRTETGKIIYLK